MTEGDKKRSDGIGAEIDKINNVLSLCNYEQFSAYSIDSINKIIDGVSPDDKLYILWNWGIDDKFAKDPKWVDIIQTYAEDCSLLIEIMSNNEDFIKQYIREQCQTIQDISLELMHLHKDYNNEDLKITIDTTVKVINKK